MGAGFDAVGFYKVDDYTIRYVCEFQVDKNYLMGQLADPMLVYEDLYESCKDTAGSLVTSTYGTSVETTMSYGPYKLTSLQDGKQMVFEQNENWYGYQKTDDGYLYSLTDFLVDGQYVQQYQSTSIIIDVMDDDAAKQAFLKGELSTWTPSADDLPTYSLSDQLYKADETYTMRLFFDTNLDDLKEMDNSKGNTNSVVMSNEKFRKALSLCIDRNEYVGATAGYKPAFALLNSLYYYDVYNDPSSQYRNTDAAKQALVNLYGVEYGDGTAYATLDDAVNSINGYNLTEAKQLMAEACQELVDAGLYTAGEDIYIRIGWAAGAIDSSATQQITLLNQYVNAALEGSGFGSLTFEGIGNITNRYADVANGEYAIGWGAWGGAAFYPYTYFQVFFDPDYTDLHEAACWDPKTETLTLNIDGEDVTMTWQSWSQALSGVGQFSNADSTTKCEILALLEEKFLEKYYCIPICSTTSCEMLAYQLSYYTDEYNIMYDFGGLRLAKYNYTDAEWSEYVSSVGGTLSYE
jgi:oligopeptide transport system substrate-binding protein